MDRVLGEPVLGEWLRERGRQAVKEAIRAVVERVRQGDRGVEPADFEPAALARLAAEALNRAQPHLRPVLNATGVLLHTGLGRAPLAQRAVARVAAIAAGYASLELDLETGDRGRRTQGVARLLCRLTGAEAAAVVNNNAAATILALHALAQGREIIVSRGQLVEIGGGFRLPEIFAAAGAILREVGTTNKTRLADYEKAISPQTAAILRVHRANFQIVGFTQDTPFPALAALAHQHGLMAIDDIGSGAIDHERPPWPGDEPRAAESIRLGADLVLFSGDKLLGGPQCGILIGRSSVIEPISRHPLMRGLRLDKLTLAALEATLELALDPQLGRAQIPLWAMISAPLAALNARALALANKLGSIPGLRVEVVDSTASVGGGSAPGQAIPSRAVALLPQPGHEITSADQLAAALRRAHPPVVARIHQGKVLLDLRSILPDQDDDLLDVIAGVCHHRASLEGDFEPPSAQIRLAGGENPAADSPQDNA